MPLLLPQPVTAYTALQLSPDISAYQSLASCSEAGKLAAAAYLQQPQSQNKLTFESTASLLLYGGASLHTPNTQHALGNDNLFNDAYRPTQVTDLLYVYQQYSRHQ